MKCAVAILAFYGTRSGGTTAFIAPSSCRPSSHCARQRQHPVSSTLSSTTTTTTEFLQRFGRGGGGGADEDASSFHLTEEQLGDILPVAIQESLLPPPPLPFGASKLDEVDPNNKYYTTHNNNNNNSHHNNYQPKYDDDVRTATGQYDGALESDKERTSIFSGAVPALEAMLRVEDSRSDTATSSSHDDDDGYNTYDVVSSLTASQDDAAPAALFAAHESVYSTTTTSLRMTATSTTTATEEPMEDNEPLERESAETSKTSTTGDDEQPLPRGKGSTLTERMFQKIPSEQQAGGAGGASTYKAFLRADENWSRLKEFQAFEYDTKLLQFDQKGKGPSSQFVSTDGAFGNPACWKMLRKSIGQTQLDYDVVVCGGTLGIFYGMYLQLQGHRVCVVEGGKLRGREQEWNISMDELDELVELGVLTPEDVEAVITTEFPACRSGFKNQEVTPLTGGYFDNDQTGYECYTPDVLNLGVTPSILIERVADRFRYIGGTILEETPLQGICVSELIGTAIDFGTDKEPITTKLVLDCMGNGSPISRQQRYGQKADGICCVVGSCAGGYDKETNLYGDIIYTNQPITTKERNGSNQYFWEAFPVGIGRNGNEPGTSDVKTTYMFTYMDADLDRPSLHQLFEDYWELLPTYQPSITNPETDLNDIRRILFAYFPTYRESPLKPEFSRVLAVGDASGIQSPLSFGGFGALTRHLGRIGGALSEALEHDCLHKDDLGLINDYQPNLSAAWMFQKAMSVKMNKKNPDPKFINRLLATNFEVMDKMGPKTMKPFLQDVVRFDGLVGSLAGSFVADPTFMPQIVATVGIPELVRWLGHVGNMGKYSLLDTVATPILEPYVQGFLKNNPRETFKWKRRFESWKYGSGGDYKFPPEEE